MTSASDLEFCQAMLPKVSRTFAACIALLPAPVDRQVLVAYLLCRIADTIEDTADLPVPEKERLLERFRHALATPQAGCPELATAFATPRSDDELLTREAATVLRAYGELGPAAQAEIRPWVDEMCVGMAGFARTHAAARPGHLVALESVAELDRYCYYVAGTVGHLLSGLFRVHAGLDAAAAAGLTSRATSFGLGLQLTNIIKDVADDRQRGWSFVPVELCRTAGITPDQLGDPVHAAAAGRVMAGLIAKARGHLDDALAYCLILPRSQYRLRLFCLTPLFFAIRTLTLAARDPRLLDPRHKVKITRGEVHRIILAAQVIAASNSLVQAYYDQLAGVRK
jgi:farnesyl-diphosphate farnesyltransferase